MARYPERALAGITSGEIAELVGAQPLIPNLIPIVGCLTELEVKLRREGSWVGESSGILLKRGDVVGKDRCNLAAVMLLLLAVLPSILFTLFIALGSLLAVQPERVVMVYGVASRVPIQVEPPGQADGVLLRGSSAVET
jgi:hypothetical protein